MMRTTTKPVDVRVVHGITEPNAAHKVENQIYTPPGPDSVPRSLAQHLDERISLTRNLSFLEYLSVKAGLGSMDLTAKVQATLDYAKSLGGRLVYAPAGTWKCNIVVPKGVILEGEGRGQEVNFTGPIPQVSNHTFAGGGTTFVAANPALPVIKASGTAGASTWPVFSLRNLKVSSLAGAIVAGSIGILAELSSNFEIYNVHVCHHDVGIRLGTSGKTSWSWKLDHVSVTDCGAYGIDAANVQTAAPCALNNVDVRRCTGHGAMFRKVTALSWQAGTVADNNIGVEVQGDTNGTCAIGFHDIQWETNLTRALKVAGSGTFPGGPITITGGHIVDYRGSAGDGSTWPSLFAGSVAIEYSVNEPTSRLVLDNVQMSTYDTVVLYGGLGIVSRKNCRMYQCGRFGQIFGSGSANDLEDAEFGAARANAYVSLGLSRLTYKTNDFSTYANNYYLQPINTNGANVSGMLTRGTGTFSQWAVHNGPDPDNAAFVAMEHGSNYAKVYSDKRGTGTRRKLILQSAGGEVALYDGTGAPQLAGWGTPTGGAVISNYDAATATHGQTAQVVAALLAHLKLRGDIAA